MKLPGVTKEEKRQLKEWLTSVIPQGMSRNDIADELEVTRRTISEMLNPNSSSFANGLTMLRYLQLAGAVVDAPEASPASSRLARLEGEVVELSALVRDALGLLREAPPTENATPRSRRKATGTDG